MHDALLVDEIARRVAEQLFDSEDKAQSSCLSFSLTCRSLNEPVLDVLWESQTDFVTLFKVFPPDLWEISNTSGLRFVRSPTPGEWCRFRTYARRMIKIHAPQGDWVPSDDILHLINLSQSGQILMPRMKLLDWTTSRACLPWLHHLLSPNLSVIRIDFNGARAMPVNVAVIKAFPTTNLRRIALSTLYTNNEVDDALLDLVLRSKRLKAIYVQQEMVAGSAIPIQRRVEGEQGPTELEGLTSIKTIFKTETTFLPNLFRRTTFPKIRELAVKHTGRAEWLGVDELFDPMLRSASPSLLHTLRYTSLYDGMDITSARIQTIRRFVALRNLHITSLCTATRCRFSLSDNDVSIIATAMPNLVELHLGGIPCASVVEVSINGLATLAANCTKLTQLQIHFDVARFISKALDVSSERAMPPTLKSSSSQLTELIVGRVTLGNGMEGYWVVGTALLQIFPKLKSIRYHQQLFNDYWGEVMRIIKVRRNVASLMVPDATGLLPYEEVD